MTKNDAIVRELLLTRVVRDFSERRRIRCAERCFDVSVETIE